MYEDWPPTRNTGFDPSFWRSFLCHRATGRSDDRLSNPRIAASNYNGSAIFPIFRARGCNSRYVMGSNSYGYSARSIHQRPNGFFHPARSLPEYFALLERGNRRELTECVLASAKMGSGHISEIQSPTSNFGLSLTELSTYGTAQDIFDALRDTEVPIVA